MMTLKRISAAFLAVLMIMGSMMLVANAAEVGYKMTIVYDEGAKTVDAVVTVIGDYIPSGYINISYDTDALTLLNRDGDVVKSGMTKDEYEAIFDCVDYLDFPLNIDTDVLCDMDQKVGSISAGYFINSFEEDELYFNNGDELLTVRFAVKDADAISELASDNKLVFFGTFPAISAFKNASVIQNNMRTASNGTVINDLVEYYLVSGKSRRATLKYEYDGIEVDLYTNISFVVKDEEGNPIKGAEIKVDGKTVKTDSNGEATLKLEKGSYNATITYDGYVVSSVSFDTDDDTVEAELLEIHAPGAPEKPEKVSVSTSSVKIKWNTPEDDGNSPITGYVISYGKDNDADTKTVEIDSAVTKSKSITGLSDDTKYYFKVAAVNEVGVGEYSDVIAITTEEKSSGGSSGGTTGGTTGGTGSGSQTPTTYFKVTYNLGAGTVVSGSTSENVRSGGYPTMPPTVKAPEGKIFKGWSTDGKTVKALATFKVAGNITLKAVYEDAPVVVSHASYMTGYTDGTAKPDKSITRAEAATFIARVSADFNESATYNGATFTDVPANAWYKKYVDFASSKGIITGYTDGTFKPNKEISREEFSTMMVRLAGYAADNSKSFSDVPDTHWAKTNISTLAAKGIITGYTDGTFGLGKKIKRAEAVTMINRYLGRVPDAALVKAYCDANKYPANDIATHWAFAQMVEAMVAHDATAFHK